MSRLSIRAASQEAPDRIALIDERGELTFAQLAQLAAPEPDDGRRVLIAPRANREEVATLLGMLERRITFALANPRWREPELRDALERTSAATLILDGERSNAGGSSDSDSASDSDAASDADSDSASDSTSDSASDSDSDSASDSDSTDQLLVFTSGSSGRSKIVRLSHDALVAAAAAHAGALPWRDDDVWVLCLPLGHIGGLSVLTRSLWARRPVVLGPEPFDAAALLRSIERHHGTLLSLVPTMMRRILDLGTEPPTSLRAILLGGAAAEPSLIARARAAGWPILPTYGMSETCAQVCTQRPDDLAPEGVGPPLPGLEVRIRDGQIEVAGPTLMSGYLDTGYLDTGYLVDGWYRTGDLGRIDDRGHLHVLGRADTRIITGGENVDPFEVEAALSTHPKIREALVFGRSDPEWGETVIARIVTSAPVTDEELSEHLASRLAGFKCPKRFERVGALPRLDSGKVDRLAVERSMLPNVCDIPSPVDS